jgi:hypothetical protein
MELAQGMIRDYQADCPEQAQTLRNAFALLTPTHRMETKYRKLYKPHCRELLNRVLKSADTRPGTAAEVAITICEMSLRAVPAHVHIFVGIYDEMLKRVFGYGIITTTQQYVDGSQIRDKILSELQEKSGKKDRSLPK